MTHFGADDSLLRATNNPNLERTATEQHAATGALQDEIHQVRQLNFMQRDGAASGMAQVDAKEASNISSTESSKPGAAAGNVMNYLGYMTYAGLAASAFGQDDPLQIETRAMRFFQEKILHHHAIDNPEVWVAMGDALMTEQHLAAQGAHFKPLKLSAIDREAKREGKNPNGERDGKEAEAIVKNISAGLRSPDDYVLASKFLYSEAIEKADERAKKESVDHGDEKRLVERLGWLSGETDRTQALQTRDNSVDPVLDELGSRVSYRLQAASFMERYGSRVPDLHWDQEAKQLRDEAKAIYQQPGELSEPVRKRLAEKFPAQLHD